MTGPGNRLSIRAPRGKTQPGLELAAVRREKTAERPELRLAAYHIVSAPHTFGLMGQVQG